MGEYITMTLSDDEGEDDYYNKEISMNELEGAVSRLKIDSCFFCRNFTFAFFHCLGKYPSFQILLKICTRKSKTVLSALISNLENMLSGPGAESIFNLDTAPSITHHHIDL
jgi:hypothetical protein